MRNVIIHYHLFKNAGSSIDKILRKNFGDRWMGFEGESAANVFTTAQVASTIAQNPTGAVFSTHQGSLPLPSLPDVSIYPIFFLRHPIDRIGSVYEFERHQATGSLGAEYASTHTFAEYLRWRFDHRPAVVENFHTLFMVRNAIPGIKLQALGHDASDLAFQELQRFSFFGIVDLFSESLRQMKAYLDQAFPGLKIVDTHTNKTNRGASMQERLDAMRDQLGPVLWQEVLERNASDLALYEQARTLFLARMPAEAPRTRRWFGF